MTSDQKASDHKASDHNHPSRGEVEFAEYVPGADRNLRAGDDDLDDDDEIDSIDESSGSFATDGVNGSFGLNGSVSSLPPAAAIHAVPQPELATIKSARDVAQEPANESASGAPAPRLSLVTASSPEHQQLVVAELDRLSLEQALLDVEVANARVIDLTARLVEANQRSAASRAEVEALRAHITSLEAADDVRHRAVNDEIAARQAVLDAQAAHLDAQKASTAYRWAAKVWNLRNALRS